MYINLMIEENKNIYISIWLLLITVLVAMIIVVGGLTRLTDSGLSITKWELFTGILPPLSYSEWDKAFSLYKLIPEYKIVNSSMTLNEFKYIYWWEYIHRLLGRIIGLFYIIPLIFFTIKYKLQKKFIINFYFIFFLILLQGFIGWYMVSSGLTERTDVSHYRLSVHLTLAFIIFMLLLWNFLKYKDKENKANYIKIYYSLPNIFLFLLIVQISIGALVSGLDAGKIYTTWPLMNQNFFPDDSNLNDLLSVSLFEIPSIVQFIHRNFAYLILLIFLFMAYIVYSNDKFFYYRKNIIVISCFLTFQIFLGILTILYGAQIALSSLHQIGSIFLITASIFLVYKNSKN